MVSSWASLKDLCLLFGESLRVQGYLYLFNLVHQRCLDDMLELLVCGYPIVRDSSRLAHFRFIYDMFLVNC